METAMFGNMFKKISPEEFMTISSQVCHLYSINISDINMPEVPGHGASLPIVTIRIQHKWLETITCDRWEEERYWEFHKKVHTWIDNSAERCPTGENYHVWFTTMWKRGAEALLGLTQAQ